MAALLGSDSEGTDSDFALDGSTSAWEFSALSSFSLGIIKMRTKVSNPTLSACRLGIYSDGGASPGSLLAVASVDSLAAAQGTGVFQATLGSTVPITSGVFYWLAVYGDTSGGANFFFQGTALGGLFLEDTGANFPEPFVSAGSTSLTVEIWGEGSGAPNNFALSDFDYSRHPKPLLGHRL